MLTALVLTGGMDTRSLLIFHRRVCLDCIHKSQIRFAAAAFGWYRRIGKLCRPFPWNGHDTHSSDGRCDPIHTVCDGVLSHARGLKSTIYTWPVNPCVLLAVVQWITSVAQVLKNCSRNEIDLVVLEYGFLQSCNPPKARPFDLLGDEVVHFFMCFYSAPDVGRSTGHAVWDVVWVFMLVLVVSGVRVNTNRVAAVKNKSANIHDQIIVVRGGETEWEYRAFMRDIL